MKLLPDFGLERFDGQEMFEVCESGPTSNFGKQVAGSWSRLDIQERPTAAITGNDLLAIGLVRSLLAVNMNAPHDFSVTGVDDIDWAQYNEPAITTIRISKEQMGA